MYRTLRTLAALAPLIAAPRAAAAQTVVTVTDSDLRGDVAWTADNTYVLDGFVFVENGETLTIEAGTVVKGMPGQGEEASALIVARGGKIHAEGAADNPIVFTAEADDANDPDDLPLNERGLWGGVIILGKATSNAVPSEQPIEGLPVRETRAIYGCSDRADFACDDADDSGVLRYVSIRYGGSDIGGGNEINGLTMGAVGSGTVVEYVEVFNNQDDGFEWFGGTVNARYLVSAFNGDDSFDYDEGFRGNGQFWFSIQGEDIAGRAGEHDGGVSDKGGEDNEPLSIPAISNATYIGSGAALTLPPQGEGNDAALKIRDNAGGKYYNSIFHDFFGQAVDIEDLDSGADSRARLEAGDLALANNIFGAFGDSDLFDDDFADATLAANNRIVDPMLRGVSRTNDGGLDPRPADGSPALEGADHSALDDWFESTDYVGAFGDANWAAGWTFLSQAGILTSAGAPVPAPPAPTSVDPVGAEIPDAFALDQNYPNPFNPTTTIEFSLHRAQRITLAVYDMFGRQVRLLADGVQPAGRHSVSFDGSDLASGAYAYALRTERGEAVKTMALVK